MITNTCLWQSCMTTCLQEYKVWQKSMQHFFSINVTYFIFPQLLFLSKQVLHKVWKVKNWIFDSSWDEENREKKVSQSQNGMKIYSRREELCSFYYRKDRVHSLQQLYGKVFDNKLPLFCSLKFIIINFSSKKVWI